MDAAEARRRAGRGDYGEDAYWASLPRKETRVVKTETRNPQDAAPQDDEDEGVDPKAQAALGKATRELRALKEASLREIDDRLRQSGPGSLQDVEERRDKMAATVSPEYRKAALKAKIASW